MIKWPELVLAGYCPLVGCSWLCCSSSWQYLGKSAPCSSYCFILLGSFVGAAMRLYYLPLTPAVLLMQACALLLLTLASNARGHPYGPIHTAIYIDGTCVMSLCLCGICVCGHRLTTVTFLGSVWSRRRRSRAYVRIEVEAAAVLPCCRAACRGASRCLSCLVSLGPLPAASVRASANVCPMLRASIQHA
jgi:hypothetical protein